MNRAKILKMIKRDNWKKRKKLSRKRSIKAMIQNKRNNKKKINSRKINSPKLFLTTIASQHN